MWPELSGSPFARGIVRPAEGGKLERRSCDCLKQFVWPLSKLASGSFFQLPGLIHSKA